MVKDDQKDVFVRRDAKQPRPQGDLACQVEGHGCGGSEAIGDRIAVDRLAPEQRAGIGAFEHLLKRLAVLSLREDRP